MLLRICFAVASAHASQNDSIHTGDANKPEISSTSDSAAFADYYFQNALCPQLSSSTRTAFRFTKGNQTYSLFSPASNRDIGNLLATSSDAREEYRKFKRDNLAGWLLYAPAISVLVFGAVYSMAAQPNPFRSGSVATYLAVDFASVGVGLALCLAAVNRLFVANNELLRASWYYNRDLMLAYRRQASVSSPRPSGSGKGNNQSSSPAIDTATQR